MNTTTPHRLGIGLSMILVLAACGSDSYNSSSNTTAAAAPTEAPATAAPAAATTDSADPYDYGRGSSAPETAAPDTMSADTAAPAGTATAIAVGSDDENGDFVVDPAGFSLYLFATDNPTTSTCSGGCAQAWPPVIADGAPVVGDGLDQSLVGTINRDDGSTQVTYGGHPLYRFSGDAAAGDTNGQGSGGVWYLVDPTGNEIDDD